MPPFKRFFARLPMARSSRAYTFGLKRLPADLPTGPVLEIGTGRGYSTAFLSRTLLDRQIIAIDITYECFTPDALTFGHRRPWFVQASAPALPFTADTFALTTVVMTFHCLPQPRQVLREIARVLKPRGVLLLADVDGDHWIAPWFERVEHWGGISALTQAYPPATLQQMAAETGLRLHALYRRKPKGFMVWYLWRKPALR